MADNKVVLEFEVKGNGEQKAQSLRAQMRELREELARLPEGTAEFNKVQRELGALTDKVGDLGRSVNTLAGDPLERLNNSFGMIGSSLMSLDFGAANTGLQGMASAIADVDMKDIGEAAKGFASSIGNLATSLLTNPFALIAGGAALVVTQYDAILELMTQVTEEQKHQREIVDATAKAFSGEAVELEKLRYEVNQSNSSQEKRNKILAELQKKYPEYLGNIVNEKTSINDLNIALEKVNKALILKYEIQAREKSIQPLFEERLNVENKIAEAEKFRLERQNKIIAKEQEARRAGGSAAASLYAELDVLKNEQNDTVERLKGELQVINDRINGEIKKIGQTQLSLDALTVKSSQKVTETQKAESKKQTENKKQELIDRNKLTEKYLNEESEVVFMQEEKKSLTEIEFEKQRQEAARQAAIELGEIKSQYASEYAKKQAQIELEEADKSSMQRLQAEQAFQNAKLAIAQQALGGLMDLNSALTDFGLVSAKKSFQINKALGIAQATIGTYEGATAAFTTAAKSPITLAFPGYPAVMAGVAITAGLAKVAKISATKFNPGSSSTPSGGASGGGGGLGGGGGMGGGSTSAPSLDLSFINNKKTGAQPIQSYVLATNVTSAQDAQQKILDQSKLIK